MSKFVLGLLVLASVGIHAVSGQEVHRPDSNSGVIDKSHLSIAYAHAIDIVTIAEPGKRRHCTQSFHVSGGFACEAHGKETRYTMEEIAAIIDPPVHDTRSCLAGYIAIQGAILASTFFIPIAPISIALRVLVGVMLPLGAICMDANEDHSDDRVLYRNADVPLQIKLHGHLFSAS